MPPPTEQLLKAFRWKLGIPVDHDPKAPEFWRQITASANTTGYHRFVNDVAGCLGGLLAEAVRHKLGVTNHNMSGSADDEWMEPLLEHFRKWLDGNQVKRSTLVSSLMNQALNDIGKKSQTGQAAQPLVKPVQANHPVTAPKPQVSHYPKPQPQPTSFAKSPVREVSAAPMFVANPPIAPARAAAQVVMADVAPTAKADINGDTNLPAEEKSQPESAAKWKYIPIPDDPDKHTEYDARAATTSSGMSLIAARVRGKMHKHKGTNCDDWFEFDGSTPWTVLVVSDGGGSYPFSRVGSEAACQAARDFLVKGLKDISVPELTGDDLAQAADHSFKNESLHAIQLLIHEAMRAAHAAMERAVEVRQGKPEYAAVLGGRDITLSDVSATLLVAVHGRVTIAGKQHDFVMGCHVGDGMMAAVSESGELRLLATPDSGDFGGQVEFLAPRKLESANLLAKTKVFVGALRAFMVMTDGVCDDYFPNDPDLLRLYADLALNGIVDVHDVSEAEVAAALAGTSFKDADGLESSDFSTRVERLVSPDQTDAIDLRSAKLYAEKLGMPAETLPKHPILLYAGRGGIGEARTPEERLQLWLDSYHVRGSFDDRTLVVIQPGKGL